MLTSHSVVFVTGETAFQGGTEALTTVGVMMSETRTPEERATTEIAASGGTRVSARCFGRDVTSTLFGVAGGALGTWTWMLVVRLIVVPFLTLMTIERL